MRISLVAMTVVIWIPAVGWTGSPHSDRDSTAAGAVVLCELCAKPIPEGEGALLSESASKARPFRCVHCALTAQAEGSSPSTVTVRSPISKTEVSIRRGLDGWTVFPETAVFLSLPEEAGECLDRHRAFPDQSEYRRYLAERPELPAKIAVPYTIDRLAELLVSGLPAGGVRPEAPVQLLVVGMLTHLPFKQSILPEIEGALGALGDAVGARFVDATQPEGKAILSAHGVTEHLPVVMFLNGTSLNTVQGREVDLRGFPGATWSREDLESVLRQAVAAQSRSSTDGESNRSAS